MKNKSLLPEINAEIEKTRIVAFIKQTLFEQKIENVVIGMSGGIDSTVSFYLLKEILPLKNIFVAHLYFEKPIFENLDKILKDIKFPIENITHVSIKSSVTQITKNLKINQSEASKVRIGNISARVRMIMLFDLAKKHNALVIGTENKSENLLGYFTRFGDQASDIEPIEHLYKTQVFKLAKYMGISPEIINQPPSAGLWKNQTDEKELGFTYEEADQVLYLALEKKMKVNKIEKKGFRNAEKIIRRHEDNIFKHKTPYVLSSRVK